MARFKEEKALHADPVHLLELVQKAAQDLDLLYERDRRRGYHLKEKCRFDHFNQVELDIDIVEVGDECRISIEGENQGDAEVQKMHVRSKVLELLSRIQIDLDYIEPMERRTEEPTRDIKLVTDLHDKGILTDHEYDSAMKRLIEN